jgi:hypothetical protein
MMSPRRKKKIDLPWRFLSKTVRPVSCKAVCYPKRRSNKLRQQTARPRACLGNMTVPASRALPTLFEETYHIGISMATLMNPVKL